MGEIVAWMDAGGIVQHITDADVPAPAAGLTARPWPAVGVALGWRWDDNADGFVPPAPVPQAVTMRQARLALLSLGLLDDVEAVLQAIADPVQRQAALVTWEYSSHVERCNPLIEALQPALGLSAATLDDLFRQAAAL